MTNISDNWFITKKESPHDKDIWVKCIAYIRNNETGEIRHYKDDLIWDTENNCPHTFIWEEGNYGCDCNRDLFFNYAIGKKYDEIKDKKCGHEKYDVNLENPKTKEIIYREYD